MLFIKDDKKIIVKDAFSNEDDAFPEVSTDDAFATFGNPTFNSNDFHNLNLPESRAEKLNGIF